MRTTCDECQKVFTVTELSTKNHPGHIIESYFQCPHCDSKYVTSVTDQKVRRLQIEVRKLRSNLPKITPQDMIADMYVVKLKKHYAKIDKLEEEIKNKMNQLKEQLAVNL